MWKSLQSDTSLHSASCTRSDPRYPRRDSPTWHDAGEGDAALRDEHVARDGLVVHHLELDHRELRHRDVEHERPVEHRVETWQKHATRGSHVGTATLE